MKRKNNIEAALDYLEFIQSDTEEARKERERFARDLKRDQERARKRGDDPFGFYAAIRI